MGGWGRVGGGVPSIFPIISDVFLYGRWEDLDRWKWVVIDVGVILDTSASHSENFFFSTCFGAGWGTTRPYLRVPSEF